MANKPFKIDWVACPICSEPDMRRETDEDGYALIHCVNHGCQSNIIKGSDQSSSWDERRVREAIAEGWSEGNQSYDEMDAAMKMRIQHISTSVRSSLRGW